MAQLEKKNDMLRVERLAEEKAKRKVATKRQEDLELRKKQEEAARQKKLQQVEEEEQRHQEMLAKRRAEEERRRPANWPRPPRSGTEEGTRAGRKEEGAGKENASWSEKDRLQLRKKD
ncbi:inner centromere protein A-like [Cyprinus carpio]|uniref:Inner centromere protein A-like n=1 Tax=Cyprinus carpio TaxID=7962 RepID=A0A9Q9ZRG9_CYPCA|nr:inner centromere protein A-like [Cyprinus carpio]XP_042571119.1 inner centromere protein A-like [Cyprinus carpio]